MRNRFHRRLCMKMENTAVSAPQINFAAAGTVPATQTSTVSHPTVNLITQDQAKGLTYIVDPNQAQHLQMFAPDQRFVANSVEFNPVTGTLTTSAIQNGNPQLNIVSIRHLKFVVFECFKLIRASARTQIAQTKHDALCLKNIPLKRCLLCRRI